MRHFSPARNDSVGWVSTVKMQSCTETVALCALIIEYSSLQPSFTGVKCTGSPTKCTVAILSQNERNQTVFHFEKTLLCSIDAPHPAVLPILCGNEYCFVCYMHRLGERILMVTEQHHGYKKTDHSAVLAVVERTLQRAVHPLILMCDGIGDSDDATSYSHAQSLLQFRRFHPRLAHIAGLSHHISLGKEGKDPQQNVAVFDVGEAHSSLAMRSPFLLSYAIRKDRRQAPQ